MSDFHGRIMNLQPDYAKPDAHAVVYKRGFRDARHVAAEIGLEADALLVRLNEAQSDAGAWEATAQHHYEEARVAEARLAEAERDAARYRYMRGVASFRDRNGPGLYWYLPRFLPGGSAEQLDASIDASITAVSADDVINAQHDETGRTWRGPRSQLPRRYFEVEAICCLDYPRCDCNSPPEPAQEPKGCNHFPGQVNCEWCTEVPHE